MSRLGLLMDPRNQKAVEIEEIRVWRKKVCHTGSGDFFHYRYFLEKPLDGYHGRKGDVRLLKFTEPDGSVWYASKTQDVLTREGDRDLLREQALKKLSSEERAVLGFPDPDKK